MIYVILGVLLVGLLVLAAPISLGYDSGEKWLKITWLGLTLKKGLKEEKPKKKKALAPKKKRRGRARLLEVWEKRELCLELGSRIWQFMVAVFRTFSFRESEASVSLPDPMLNGLLFAAVTNIHLENVDLSVNFENQNFAKIRVTIYPYRVAGQVAILLLKLPYIRILRFAWDLKKA
jgi:hypothetical protein